MTEHKQITGELLYNNQFNYIQLGGKGLMDGLNIPPSKFGLLKIDSVNVNIDDDKNLIYNHANLKRYRARNCSKLPSYNFDQACRIFTPKEFQALPVYTN